MIKDKLLYYTVIIIKKKFSLMPWGMRKFFLKLLGRLFYYLDKKHRDIVEANLKFAFKEQYSQEERAEISKKVFQNFTFYLFDFIESIDRTENELKEMIEFEDAHHLENAIKDEKKVITVSAHFSNFELILKAIGAFYMPLTTVREKIYNSPSLDDMLKKNVQTMNVEIVPKIGAVRGLVGALKKGRAIALAVDQNTESKHGILIDFFGKKARHTPSASQLARKFDAALIPVFVTTTDYRKYKMKFFPPIEINKTDDEEADISRLTQAQADITEKMARERPDEYFWLHKRWKNQYPEIYGL